MPRELTGRTVLLTGGRGLIGAALIEELRRHAPDVRIRVLDLEEPTGDDIEFVRGSVLDPALVRRACEGADYVVHLAAALGVQQTEADKLWCLDVNIRGTVQVLEAAGAAGVEKVVFSSSSEVYGDAPELPIRETTPTQGKTVYAVSKLAGEEYVKAYAARSGFAYTIIRFFNVYGPAQDERFVVPRFVASVLADEPVGIHGDGSQVRAFCHVSDAVRGVRLALQSEAADGVTVNIGNGAEPVSILELYRRVARQCGSSLEPRIEGFSENGRTASREIHERYPDVAKARELLGYVPAIELDEGLRSVIEAHREREARAASVP